MKVPGKIFLLGEYGVLLHGRAWVMTLPPGYEGSGESSLPRGFGSSGAEFLRTDRALYPQATVSDRWRRYRSSGDGGSGADLVAQQLASPEETDLFEIHLPLKSRKTLSGEVRWESCVKALSKLLQEHLLEMRVYFRGENNKLATDRELKRVAWEELEGRWGEQSLELVQAWGRALRNSALSEMVEVSAAHEQHLLRADLLDPKMVSELKVLREDPNLVLVRGCGARGQDAVWMLLRKGTEPEVPSSWGWKQV
jgi:hypothetical protein